jgi:hypothetical protein
MARATTAADHDRNDDDRVASELAETPQITRLRAMPTAMMRTKGGLHWNWSASLGPPRNGGAIR